jgi:8-hydroxy-5-deazaflavin:NADPH oxidoreductase
VTIKTPRTAHPLDLAVLGGTGNLGLGLAYRWVRAGHRVIIGSRAVEKAEAAVVALRPRVPDAQLRALANEAAAREAEIVVVAVPFAAQRDTLAAIKEAAQGKIVIDTTVALKPPKVGTVQMPPEGSAGQIAQSLLGAGVRVVSAFQNVAAAVLDSDHEIDCDVLLTGNDPEACAMVRALAADAGMRAFHAGPIENSVAVEGLTSILITLNRRYKLGHAGIRITGL